jgi:hypothetical protein
MSENTCRLGDGRPATSNGYCRRHALNLRLTGNPIPHKEWPLEDRLRDVGWTVTESGCWEWNGKRTGRTPETSYGIFNAKRLGYDGARATRAMYECFVGSIPEGMQIRHKCDNPPCVNPEHLIPGTAADNSRDMVERRRHWRHDRERCDKGHDLTLPGAVLHTKSANRCAECYRDAKRSVQARTRRAQGIPPRNLLGPEQVTEIRQRRSTGASLKEIGTEFGVSIQTVSGICTGRIYRNVSGSEEAS